MRTAARRALEVVGRSPLRRPLRRLAARGVVPQGLWRRLPVTGEFEIRTPSGAFRYDAPKGDALARNLFWCGLRQYQKETLEEFDRTVSGLLHPLVVDVGANRGVFTLTALAASSTAEVVALEPTPSSADHIERQVELNGWTDRVRSIRAAVTDQEGTQQFRVPHLVFPSGARLVSSSKPGATNSEVIDVDVVALDGLVERADIVKIDVEGAEHLVLAGMRRLLAEARPVVFMEVLPEGRLGDCEAVLSSHGYELFHLTGDGPVRRDRLVPDHDRRFLNYVCRPVGGHGESA